MAIYLKNCAIADGTGSPIYKSGILIEGNRIAAITDTQPDTAGLEVLDCDGLLATPGFIDAHSHNDWFALSGDKARYLLPFVRQGITTFVTGNCGFSVTGYEADTPFIDEIGGGLFALDEESKPYPAYSAWFAQLDKKSIVNVASLAGHGSARIGVNGKGPGALASDRFERMLATLEQALQDGACGVSLGLMYEPGIFAPKEELLAVARLVKQYDRILTVHPKAMSNISLSYSTMTKSHLMLALRELEDIVRETGVRFQYSHLLFIGKRTWPDEPKALAVFADLVRDGFDVGFDMYPLDYGASIITVVLPEWYMKLSPAARNKPFNRFKLWVMIQLTTRLLGFGFPDITISYAGAKHPELIGKTISELAKEWGVSEFAAYLRACEESNFEAKVLQGKYQNIDIVKRLMAHELSLYMTDAWVEDEGKQNGGIYGAFPMFLEIARDSGFPLETAIAKMSGHTAKRFQLRDRGELRLGAFADVNLIDLSRLQSRIAQELPPLGIRHVFINGQQVIRDEEYLAAAPSGMAIRVGD